MVLPERVDPAWPLQRMSTHHHQQAAVWTRMLVKGVMGRSEVSLPEDARTVKSAPASAPASLVFALTGRSIRDYKGDK